MITIMKPNASNEAVKKVTDLIEFKGLTTYLSKDSQVTIVGVVNDKTKLLDANIEISEGVDEVVVVTESYKLVNKKFRPGDPVTPVDNTHISPGTMTVMVGPYVIESLDQLLGAAHTMKKARATFLRGGAYEPHTSPYSFQGLEKEEPKYMEAAKEATGLNVIYEVTSVHTIKLAMKYVDMLRIGARNVQNFELLKGADKSGTPVLLRRGPCTTIDEWLSATEHIISEGNPNIVLRKRGIRTYGASTRNILDISTAPVIRQKNHLPIIVDPNHATGIGAYVKSLTKAAITVGAGGLTIEVHPYPAKTLSDGPQPLTFDTFEQSMKDLAPYVELPGWIFKAQ